MTIAGSAEPQRTQEEVEKLVSAEVLSLMERVHEIEIRQANPKSKTLVERLGVWGGGLALIISITGGFTLYDSTVSKPREDLDKKVQQVQATLSSISSVTQEIGSKLASISDPNQRANAVGLANMQILSLVRSVEGIEPGIRERLNVSDYLTLGTAEGNIGSFDSAKKYFFEATKKTTDSVTHAEVLRLYGRMLVNTGVPGDLDVARRAYADSAEIRKTYTNFSAPVSRAILDSDRIILEYYLGSCSDGDKYLLNFLDELRSPFVSAETRKALKANLADSIRGEMRCPWDKAALSSSL